MSSPKRPSNQHLEMEAGMKTMNNTTKVIAALFVVTAVAIPGVWAAVNASQAKVQAETVYKETTVDFGNLTVGVEESGSVTIGTVSQAFDLTLGGSASSSGAAASAGSTSTAASSQASQSTTSSGATGNGTAAAASSSTSSSSGALEVETVFVVVGQAVQVGDPLLKLTPDSISATRTILTDAVTSARLAFKQAKVNRSTATLAAKSEYAANKALSQTAKAEYKAAISSLTATVSNAQNVYDSARQRIADIPDEISSRKADLADARAAGNASQASALQKQIDTLQTELQQTKASLGNLNNQLAKARRNKISGSIAAKAQYDESLLIGQNASTLYQIAMDGMDDSVNTAADALTSAKANLAEFESFVGEGEILSDYTGVLTTVGYMAGSTLSSATAIATFQNAAAVTMTVSVAQDDISAIKIGGQASIELSAYENVDYTGSVTQIATATTNNRSSTVSYPVTVTLSGDVSEIYASMTGNVTFVTKQVQDVLYVSNKAIILDGTRSYVKQKNSDGSVSQVEVTTGFSDGYQVEIVSGLKEGDTVLIESQVKAE